MRDACLALDYPIISGNVSLYNETSGVAVQPTPAIGGVGVIADVARAVGNAFLKPNESIILIGETKGHVGASIYLREIEGSEEGAPPRVDLTLERKNGDFVRGLIESGKVSACHDISDGGLYVAIFEMAIRNKIGAKILVPTGNSSAEKKQLIAYLFGEDQARYIITTDNAEDILSLARDAGVSITIIGQTNSSGNLSINGEFVTLEELGHIYESALPDIMA
jgi:phosphoribosylformylglycinamidine synthase